MNNQSGRFSVLRILQISLLIIGGGIAAAWNVEASTVGRGFISVMLAPIAILCILWSAILGIILKPSKAVKQSNDSVFKKHPLD